MDQNKVRKRFTKTKKEKEEERANFLWFSGYVSIFFFMISLLIFEYYVPTFMSSPNKYLIGLEVGVACGWVILMTYMIVQLTKQYKQKFKK